MTPISVRPAGEPVVTVRGLRMSYGPHEVLTGVDLDIHEGEVICLLGPNGAGKTTTIEILEGFRLRSDGDVRVLGEDPADGGDAWRARVGVVLQSWRDHARWTPRRLLEQLGGYFAPVRHAGAAPALRARLAARHRRAGRERRPQDRHPVRRSAAPAGRRRGIIGRPNCSSWTSRPPASTHRRGGTSTTWCTGSPTWRARPSCSPRTTWPRPSAWPTGS